jgi:hypothetical protein
VREPLTYAAPLAAPARRYGLIIGVLAGALLLTGVALVWAVFFRGPSRRPHASDDRDGVPGFPGLRYVRAQTRQQTVLATLRSGGLPTLEGRWYYIGPFDNPPVNQGFDVAYPPEKQIDLNKEYPGKGGKPAAWKHFKGFELAEINDFTALFPADNENACVYVYHEIEMREQLALPISLGSDDTLTVWLNGERLLGKKMLRACAPDQDHVTLQLRPGKNRLLIKVCNVKGKWALYVCPEFPKPIEAAYAGLLLRDFPPPRP